MGDGRYLMTTLNRIRKALMSLIFTPYEMWKNRLDWIKSHEDMKFFEEHTFDLGVVRE